MKTFAIFGVGGYIAPKHLEAIKQTGGNLVCAYDPHDSVGVLDKYFPDCHYFHLFETFDRFINKKGQKKIDYLVVCSPNYLHDAHCRYGLRNGMDVICEKPLVLNPHNAESLIDIENETGKKVNCILQLRLHPTIIDLKKKIESTTDFYEVNLTYNTPRGKWYGSSWKGDVKKSGGLSTNIGIHFFDMLQWVFGEPVTNVSGVDFDWGSTGYTNLKRASVMWNLSITEKEAVRKMEIKGFYDIDFTTGFSDLHTISYSEILAGRGFGISDCIPSIKMVTDIRNADTRD